MEGAGGIVGGQGRTPPLATTAQGNQPNLLREPQLTQQTRQKDMGGDLPFRVSILEPLQAQLVLKECVIRQQ